MLKVASYKNINDICFYICEVLQQEKPIYCEINELLLREMVDEFMTKDERELNGMTNIFYTSGVMATQVGIQHKFLKTH